MVTWSDVPRWAARLASGAALGLAVIVPLGLLAGWAGYPLTGLGVAVLLFVGLVTTARALRQSEPLAPESIDSASASRVLVALGVLALLLALGVFLYKLVVWPLWSWDHYQIWGVKARRMVLDGRLDLAFLREDALLPARPDYPLGVPFLARLLALGGVPGEVVFKTLHAACGLGLAALLLDALRRAAASWPIALALTTWAASGPLFWDSEAYGLAEMPLAFVLVAAVLGALEWQRAPTRGRTWHAGLLIGLLPWIKHEGRLLALFLLVALFLASPRGNRWRTWRSLAAVAIVPLALERVMAQWGLAPGVSFLSGQPFAKLAERLPQASELLASMAQRLAQWDFLGFWLLFPLAFALAWRRRNVEALIAGGVVLAQLAVYSGLTFLVYLPVEEHLDAAYDRITAALVPLGILACGLALVGSPHEDPPDRLRHGE